MRVRLAWFPPVRLTYSPKNKLISLLRLLFYRIKIFNRMRSHQVSQMSHFWIKYEFGISLGNFTPCVFSYRFLYFISFVVFVTKKRKFSYLLHNRFFVFQIQFNHTSQTAKICLDHYFIVCLMYVLTFLLHSGSYSTILSSSKVYQILFVNLFSTSWRQK